MILKFEKEKQYNDDVKINYDEIFSKIIYCLYYKQYNVIVNCIMVEQVDGIIAYSDDKQEIIEYRNELIQKEKYISVHLYIKSILNIVSYRCQKK